MNDHPIVPPSEPIAPVPLNERLPAEADCDAEGRCWLYEHFLEEWRLGYGSWVARFPVAYSHWLPHYALPIPTPTTETRND